MTQVNFLVAKHLLPRLIERAPAGGCVVIAQAGNPLVRLMHVAKPTRRLGFMRGGTRVADDFNQKGSAGIEAMSGATACPGPVREI